MLSRRSFVLGSGAAAVAAASFPQMAMAGVNFVAWHNNSHADHKAQVDKYAALGYRTSSLSIYGPVNDVRYAAVMILRPTVIAEHQIMTYAAADYQTAFNDMASKGFGPYIVSATGSANDPRFAVSFRPMASIPLTRHGMTGAEFQAQNFKVMLDGGVLAWADAYGDANDVRYIAVWHPNPANIGWGCNSGGTGDILNDDPATTQAIFNAQTSAGARLAHIAPTPSGGYMTLYADTEIGGWVALAEMSGADYQDAFNAQTAKGLFPLRVLAKATPSGTKFAAIFTAQEDIVPRTIRFSQTTPSIQAIDDVLSEVMKQGDVRGLSVAITSGPRLVYTKGVTFGEPDYPQIMPETPFRQASVSKLLCTVALYALLQKGHDFKADPLMNGPLSTKIQSILNVSAPPGLTQDPNWAKIQIRHLLESTSAINFGTPWASGPAVQDFPGAQLPASANQLLSWASVQKFTATPGDPTNVIYGNDGYLVLGEVVRHLAGTPDLASALKTLVCAPLGMKNTIGSTSLVQNQPASEARYHNRIYALDGKGNVQLAPLTVGPSLLSKDQPLVATQYGAWWEYETSQGCGSLSCAVIDIARIVAMFNTAGPHPVLSAEAINALLTNAQNATMNLTGPNPPNAIHGYHGLDWCQAWGTARRAQKGGWIPSHECLVDFVSEGGCGVMMQVNGNKRKEASFMLNGAAASWLDKLYDIAYNTNWGDNDLFHSVYGMSTLVPGKFQKAAMQMPSASAATLTSQTLASEMSVMKNGAIRHPPRPVLVPVRRAPPRGPGPLTLTRPSVRPRRGNPN